MSQKACVTAILDANIEAGLTGEAFREACVAQIGEGLTNGTIPWSGDKADPKKVKTYAGALVSNYLKKEANYNAGVPYKDRKGTKGPRVKDPELVELKTNLASLKAQPMAVQEAHAELIARTETAIKNREEFLAAQKATKDVIPLEDAVANLNRRLAV